MIHIIKERSTDEQMSEMSEQLALEVQDPALREQIAVVVRRLLGGV